MSIAKALILLLLLDPFVVHTAQPVPAGPNQEAGDIDRDRDGLPDEFEQLLLNRFAPLLMISRDDCDSLPAEFQPGFAEPKVAARNATVYGQVSPFQHPGKPGAFLEAHYYHLWERDCGRLGHDLDAEHVAVLLSAPDAKSPPGLWKATHWQAFAHEDTSCDATSGAPAAFLAAEERGARIWVSRGKHASFLLESACGGGCGSDRCDAGVEVVPGKIVNLGEPGALLNGAMWVNSPRWPLASKMRSAFTPAALARLEDPSARGVVELNRPDSIVRAASVAGSSSADAVGTGDQKVRSGTETGARHAGRALRRAARAVGGFLGIGGKPPGPEKKPGADSPKAQEHPKN
jgi:hypothetical protein